MPSNLQVTTFPLDLPIVTFIFLSSKMSWTPDVIETFVEITCFKLSVEFPSSLSSLHSLIICSSMDLLFIQGISFSTVKFAGPLISLL